MTSKICELQRTIDEYERFVGDLLILVIKGDRFALEHDLPNSNAGVLWDEVYKMRNKLAQFSQENTENKPL
jgi:hypothetical protein